MCISSDLHPSLPNVLSIFGYTAFLICQEIGLGESLSW